MGMDTCQGCGKRTPDLFGTCVHCGARLWPLALDIVFWGGITFLVLGLAVWLVRWSLRAAVGES